MRLQTLEIEETNLEEDFGKEIRFYLLILIELTKWGKLNKGDYHSR